MPYCSTQEMETLRTAASYIFHDMQTQVDTGQRCNYQIVITFQRRHQHALDCYSVTQTRSAALLKWIKIVIRGVWMDWVWAWISEWMRGSENCFIRLPNKHFVNFVGVQGQDLIDKQTPTVKPSTRILRKYPTVSDGFPKSLETRELG